MTALKQELRAEVELKNVAAWLPRLANDQPDALSVAVVSGDTTTTMSALELNKRADKMAHALTSLGIARGTRCVLMVKPSPEFFGLTFALLKIGAVPVLVDPGMGIKNLGACLAEAEPEAFIGIKKAHVARTLFGWAKRSVKTKICVGGFPFAHDLLKVEAAQTDAPFPACEPELDELAAILFTSGSTGIPKGVLTTHGNFLSQVRLLKKLFGIEPGERDLSTFPLFALFGPALGMAAIVPDMDASKPAQADPEKLLAAFNAHGCTNFFGSPALIENLGKHCEATGAKLPGLKRAISAGAPASAPSIARFAKLLDDGAQVFTPYGATESLPVAVIGSDEILSDTRHATEAGKGVCVGAPAPEMEVKIVAITDEVLDEVVPLPQGEIGEIVVSGPVVTRGYYGRERATSLAKIKTGGTLWHRMGDVGYLDDKGRLWMCGRKAHRVVLEDEVLFTVPVEARFNTIDGVRRTALVRKGQQAALCVELDAGASWNEVEPKLKSRAPELSIASFLHHRKSFPVDVRHNSKIFREKLAVWAEQQ